MSPSPELHMADVTPERLAVIVRRARVERSRVLWAMLQSIFGRRADAASATELAAPSAQCCR